MFVLDPFEPKLRVMTSNWAFTSAFDTRSSQKSNYPNRNCNCKNTKAPCTTSENAIKILQFN